jgi:hypothetical protein
VIGCGGRVTSILGEAPADLRVIALSDCDLRRMSAESVLGTNVRKMDKFSQAFPKWARYQDYRKMLDKEKLDAVFVTTTTHARALICLHAVQAGLDVYTDHTGPVEVWASKPGDPMSPVTMRCAKGTLLELTLPHLENWIDCMRSRKRPNADVEIAHRSSTVCHLVNVARDLGRRLRWDPEQEVFIGDDAANRHPSVTRPRRKGYGLPQVV